MTRRLESPVFLCWVAFCSAVAAAITSGVALHDSPAARVGAALAGVVIGMAFAFGTFALVELRRSPPPVEVVAELPVAPAAEHEPVVDDLRERLETQLVAGRELRDEPLDSRVDEWIAATGRLLQDGAPGAARYFGALEPTAWPAHLARLETILRDFL